MSVSLSVLGTYSTGSFDEGAAEISAFDPTTNLLFVVNSNAITVDILDLSDPATPTKVGEIDATQFGAGANSVAVNDGILAVAIESDPPTDPGKVVFFSSLGDILAEVPVGALPDMVTFTPDGTRVLVANEGEPADGVNPVGSISVIDLSNGVENATVQTAGFERFDGQEDQLRAAGVRIFPGQTFSVDAEPEYVAVSADSAIAYVTLQEANTVAVVDIASATVTNLLPLGTKDHSQPGNELDPSDRDGGINLKSWPVFGLYMPDAIATYEAGGETYFVIANEGDDRGDADDPEGSPLGDVIRVKDLGDVATFGREGLALDESFPADIVADDQLGRLNISSIDGDTDGDGDIDQLFAYGSRSFSIFNSRGELVFDSGSDFERITANLFPTDFNATNDENGSFENRSDNKGPEPEGVAIGQVGDKTYAFIGLERIGGVMVYDITDPANAEFVQYVNNRNFAVEAQLEDGSTNPDVGDLGPEGLTFIAAEDSPSGTPLLVVTNEISGTTTVYDITEIDHSSDVFTLELFHTADQEAGIPALDDAPRFSAVLNALKAQDLGNDGKPDNTLVLSSGDTWLPGLFYGASTDVFGAPGIGDVLIQNELGFQAIAFGNHEFDEGTSRVSRLLRSGFVFEGVIEEAQQVTPVADGPAIGSFTATLSGNTLTVTGEFSELSNSLLPVGEVDSEGNPQSSIHIHIGEAGSNGPIARNLTVTLDDEVPGAGEFSGSFTLTNAEAALARAGQLYLNLHTEANPSGELRGQIAPEFIYSGTDFPYLSSNLDFSTDSNLADLVVPDAQAPQGNSIAASTVIDVNGEKIGVVGATTPTIDVISSPGGITIAPLEFDGTPTPAQLDALAAEIQADVDALLAANPDVNKVVLLTHMQQIAIEQALATRLTHVDIIVAGGSNTRLLDETDRLRDGDTAQGTYPIFTTSADGNPVAIVNTDGNYKYVGRLVVDFDANGVIIPESYDPAISGAYAIDDQGVADLNAGDLVDPEIQDIVDQLRAVIEAQQSNVFGISEVYLDGTRGSVRTQETNLGNLTADANLAIAKEITGDDTILVSLKNGGGIRDDIGRVIVPAGGTGEPVELPNEGIPGVKPEGGISEPDIVNTLAFNNGLTVLDITREGLLAVLEHGVAASSLDDANTQGRFPQVSGIEFSFDLTLPPGDRIQSAAIVDEAGTILDVLVQNGELVGDPSDTLRIVTLNFLAGGGDGYPFQTFGSNFVELAQAEDAPRTGEATFAPDGSEQDALAEYLFDNFFTTPFTTEETPRELDERLQNLAFRADTVLGDGGVVVPPPLQEITIDFEGDGLTAGTLISDQFDGLAFSTTWRFGLMLFDTANPTGRDFDLASDTLGNVLIISEDGDASDPDDRARGGTITVEFDDLAVVTGVGLLDIDKEGSLITFKAADGSVLETYEIPDMGDNSFQQLSFDIEAVASMDIFLKGSGALTGVDFSFAGAEPTVFPAMGESSLMG